MPKKFLKASGWLLQILVIGNLYFATAFNLEAEYFARYEYFPNFHYFSTPICVVGLVICIYCFLANKNKEVKINIAGNAAISSSILKMGATHEESAPDSKYIKTEIVRLITLDSIFNKYFEKNDICLLKIDVQGYEDQVLKGAANCIKKFNLINLIIK